jgi:hypothetical protein
VEPGTPRAPRPEFVSGGVAWFGWPAWFRASGRPGSAIRSARRACTGLAAGAVTAGAERPARRGRRRMLSGVGAGEGADASAEPSRPDDPHPVPSSRLRRPVPARPAVGRPVPEPAVHTLARRPHPAAPSHAGRCHRPGALSHIPGPAVHTPAPPFVDTSATRTPLVQHVLPRLAVRRDVRRASPRRRSPRHTDLGPRRPEPPANSCPLRTPRSRLFFPGRKCLVRLASPLPGIGTGWSRGLVCGRAPRREPSSDAGAGTGAVTIAGRDPRPTRSWAAHHQCRPTSPLLAVASTDQPRSPPFHLPGVAPAVHPCFVARDACSHAEGATPAGDTVRLCGFLRRLLRAVDHDAATRWNRRGVVRPAGDLPVPLADDGRAARCAVSRDSTRVGRPAE